MKGGGEGGGGAWRGRRERKATTTIWVCRVISVAAISMWLFSSVVVEDDHHWRKQLPFSSLISMTVKEFVPSTSQHDRHRHHHRFEGYNKGGGKSRRQGNRFHGLGYGDSTKTVPLGRSTDRETGLSHGRVVRLKAACDRQLPETLMSSLKAHDGAIYVIRYDKDGTYIMSAGEDKCVRLWNARQGTLVKTYPVEHTAGITDLLIMRNRDRFITADEKGNVLMWDSVRGVVIRRFRGCPPSNVAGVTSMALNSDESILCSACTNGIVYIWDLAAAAAASSHQSLVPLQILDHANGCIITSLFLSQPILFVGCADGKLRAYDVRSGKLLVRKFFRDHPEGRLGRDNNNSCSCRSSSRRGGRGRNSIIGVSSVSVSKDSRLLLVSCLDHTLRLIDRRSGVELKCYKGHKNWKLRLRSEFVWDNSLIATPSEDGKIYFWNLVTGRLLVHTNPSEPSYFHSLLKSI